MSLRKLINRIWHDPEVREARHNLERVLSSSLSDLVVRRDYELALRRLLYEVEDVLKLIQAGRLSQARDRLEGIRQVLSNNL